MAKTGAFHAPNPGSIPGGVIEGSINRRSKVRAVQPELEIGPVTLQTFGIMFALGFIAAGALVARRLQELGKPVDWAYEMIFAALVGGIVGSRLDFIIENYDSVKDDLLGNIFSGSGLIWYGGAIGGAIAVVLWAWWRGMLNLTLLDIAAPGLAIGYAVGRIGCQLSGDGDYGIPWDGPWAMAYPEGTVPTTATVHPTPIYETVVMGLVAYALWRLRDRFQPGLLFALYLVLAGVERFLIEFIRRNDEVLLGLTQAQVISVVMIAAGAVWLGVKARRGELYSERSMPPSIGTDAPVT
jgi:phosphatidylglycerol:prolipoprotein diacylglycerol transferase